MLLKEIRDNIGVKVPVLNVPDPSSSTYIPQGHIQTSCNQKVLSDMG